MSATFPGSGNSGLMHRGKTPQYSTSLADQDAPFSEDDCLLQIRTTWRVQAGYVHHRWTPRSVRLNPGKGSGSATAPEMELFNTQGTAGPAPRLVLPNRKSKKSIPRNSHV